VWPEYELEDIMRNVTCAIVTVTLRVYELIVVTTSEDPINRFTNPNLILVTETRDNNKKVF
jgi:hypothetical protein